MNRIHKTALIISATAVAGAVMIDCGIMATGATLLLISTGLLMFAPILSSED